MIAVIFEVWPRPERRGVDPDVAAALRPELEAMDGFISVERFESLSEPGKLLSLSFWRDESSSGGVAQSECAPRGPRTRTRRHLC